MPITTKLATESSQAKALMPEEIVTILRKWHCRTDTVPSCDEQVPELIEYLIANKKLIDAALTRKQAQIFWQLFDAMKNEPLNLLSGNRLQNVIAFALSRDVYPVVSPEANEQERGLVEKIHEDIEDALDVYSVGLGTQVLRKLITAKNIKEASCFLEEYQSRYNEAPSYVFDINEGLPLTDKHKLAILKSIEEKLVYLLIWGPTTKEKSSPQEILQHLFKGISTVALTKLSAHGVKGALPLASYMHDLFHYEDYHKAMVGSLVQFTFNKVMMALPSGRRVEDLVAKWSQNAIDRFELLSKNLSEFHARMVATQDNQTLAGLFYLFHEGGNNFMKIEDWENYQDLPQLLGNLVSRLMDKKEQILAKSSHGTTWSSPIDPFHSDPTTGVITASDEQLQQAARKKIIEFVEEDKAKIMYQWLELTFNDMVARDELVNDEYQTMKKLQGDFITGIRKPIFPYQFQEQSEFLEFNAEHGATKLRRQEANQSSLLKQLADKEIKLISARMQASLVTVEIIRSKRFARAKVSRTYTLEPKYVVLCTTLYHKRRNAWDAFHLLGGAQSGLARPDTLKTRETTMQYLKDLYHNRLPKAFQQMVAACNSFYDDMDPYDPVPRVPKI